MSDMIERVARALYEEATNAPHDPYIDPWPRVREKFKSPWLSAARAAIEALREPTPEMIEASNREWDGRMSHRSSGAWQAMIAAALKPEVQP